MKTKLKTRKVLKSFWGSNRMAVCGSLKGFLRFLTQLHSENQVENVTVLKRLWGTDWMGACGSLISENARSFFCTNSIRSFHYLKAFAHSFAPKARSLGQKSSRSFICTKAIVHSFAQDYLVIPWPSNSLSFRGQKVLVHSMKRFHLFVRSEAESET